MLRCQPHPGHRAAANIRHGAPGWKERHSTGQRRGRARQGMARLAHPGNALVLLVIAVPGLLAGFWQKASAAHRSAVMASSHTNQGHRAAGGCYGARRHRRNAAPHSAASLFCRCPRRQAATGNGLLVEVQRVLLRCLLEHSTCVVRGLVSAEQESHQMAQQNAPAFVQPASGQQSRLCR